MVKTQHPNGPALKH